MSSVLFPRVASYAFSSDPVSGAKNVHNSGSSFSVALNKPISIPSGAISCTVDVVQANIWFVTPNISAALGNNNFYFSSATTNPGNYHIVIPDGLYSLDDLNTTLQREFANLGFASNIIVLTPDGPTSRAILSYTISGLDVDFTQPNTVRTVLGFNSRQSPPTPPSAAGESDYGDIPASFNQINSFYIRSSLTAADGLPINNTAAGIIAAIPIDVEPGAQIVYKPQTPVSIDASSIIGRPVQSINFDLVDDKFRPINTLGEYWSLILHIHYSVLMSTEKVPLISI